MQPITSGGAHAAPPPRPGPATLAAAEQPRPAAARPTGAPLGASFPGPAAFRASQPGPEDKLIAQLAFAMAAEAGTPPRDAEAMQALRDQATTTLSEFAFRYLHNRVEEIRREAAAEATGAAARGPRLGTLVLANLIALALGGAAVWALATQTHLLAGLAGH